MAYRNIWVNTSSGLVQRICNIKIEVRRDGAYFVFRFNRKIQARGEDITIVLKSMQNVNLRQRIINAFQAQDTKDLRQKFRGYNIRYGALDDYGDIPNIHLRKGAKISSVHWRIKNRIPRQRILYKRSFGKPDSSFILFNLLYS